MTIRRLLPLLIVVVMLLSWMYFRPGRQIVISRATTYITQPLTEDGLPDYVAYLREKHGAGVTPENNAVVCIWQAIGPEPIPQSIRGELFHRLGIEPLPLRGDYFVPTDDTRFVESGTEWLTTLRDVPASRDDKLADGTALEPAGEEEQAAQQGAKEAFKELVDLADKRPWSPDTFPPLRQWLQDNRHALHLARVASERSRYYGGYLSIERPALMSQFSVADLQALRLSHGLAIRAMSRIGEKRFHEAQRDISAIHRLARLISRIPQGTVPYLVGIAQDGAACDAQIALAADPDTPIPVLRESLQQLRGLSRWKRAADTMDDGERLIALDAILSLQRRTNNGEDLGEFGKALVEHFGIGLAIDMNVVLREINRGYDQLVEAMRLPDRETRSAAVSAIDKTLRLPETGVMSTLRFALSRTARSQMIAGVFLDLTLASMEASLHAEDRANMQLDLTTIAMTLAVYRAEHGTYPDALEQLAPDLLDAVPPDLYTGEPLRYERRGKGYLLYSVSTDGNDNGGCDRDGTIIDGNWVLAPDGRNWGDSDLIVRVPIPPLKASLLWSGGHRQP
ncbi:MAG: hypothetical protein ACC645_13135 [Pirellulales bacterium]